VISDVGKELPTTLVAGNTNQSGTSKKLGLHYHPDAIFMPPGERLEGWENIRT